MSINGNKIPAMAEQQNFPELIVTHNLLAKELTAEAIKPVSVVSDDATKLAAKVAPKIVLATLNARYFHTSFGLRYLYANLKELQPYCEIKGSIDKLKVSRSTLIEYFHLFEK